MKLIWTRALMASQTFPSLKDGQDLLHDPYAGMHMSTRSLEAPWPRVLPAGDKVQAPHSLLDINGFDIITLTQTHVEQGYECRRSDDECRYLMEIGACQCKASSIPDI
jgi:hypothetical protein